MKERIHQRYRRKKLAGQVSKLFWSALCLVLSLIIVVLIIRWLAPWALHLLDAL